MRFAKWQGLGNDYLVVDEQELPRQADGSRALTDDQVRAICNRHFGVGGDGILVMGPATGDADAMMLIHNPDGSQAEMCGNGIRMAARWLLNEGRVAPGADGSFTIATAGGPMRPRMEEANRVRVDMGLVRTDGLDEVTIADGSSWRGRVVDVGNPHFVIEHNPDAVALEQTGRQIERHARFPNRTNVEFVERLGDAHVRMRVWERGVGETLACGTGACAVGLTAVLDLGCTSPVTVSLPGGDLVIEVTPEQHVFMTGPAEEVYRGELDVEQVTAHAASALAAAHEEAIA